MKRMLAVGIVALVAGLAIAALQVNAAQKDDDNKVLRHVVLFKFTDEESAKSVSKDLAALEDKIDAIKDLEWGTNVSEQGLNKGLTHAFTITFENQEGLEAYDVHPAHKALVASLEGKVADICVIDYWAQK